MYKIEQLKSGLKVLLAPMAGANTVTLLLVVGTGSKYESREVSGISHFLEHMMFKGTNKHPNAQKLSSALDALGSEFNAFTGKEYTGYYIKVDKKLAKQAGELLADMLINSKFNQQDFDRERGVIIEEINMYEDNPMMHIEDVFEQCLFGDTPAGWDTAGDKDTVAKMPHQELVRYFKKQYQVGNSVLVIAGDTSVIKKADLEKNFGAFGIKHKAEAFDFKEKVTVHGTGNVKLKFKQTDQAHLSLGVPAVASGTEDELALKLLSVVLGGSMSSRMFSELREKRGLAYYVHTQTESYTDCGYLTTQAGVPVDKIEESIRIILDEYKKVVTKSIKADELKRIKDMINGKLALRLEASDEIANWYSRQAILGLTQEREGDKVRKIYEPKGYLAKLNKLTAKDLQLVAKKYLSADKLNLAIIGPYKDEQKFKQLLKF